MKKFFSKRRSWWNDEKRVPDSSGGNKDHLNCPKDTTHRVAKTLVSKSETSQGWQRSEKTMSSGRSQSIKKSNKSIMRLSSVSKKLKKSSRFVLDVVGEVLNFKKRIP